MTVFSQKLQKIVDIELVEIANKRNIEQMNE